MEMQEANIRRFGYGEPINCRSLHVHVFPKEDLERNLPDEDTIDSPLVLSEADFSKEIPCVQYSKLEIIPGDGESDPQLFGTIRFSTPSKWDFPQPLDAVYTKLTQHFEMLLQLDHSSDNPYSVSGEQLQITMPSGATMAIEFGQINWQSGEVNVILPLTQQGLSLYRDIWVSASLWGGLHDFIIQADSDLPYTRVSNARPGQIIVGTTSKTVLSGAVLAIESRLGQLEIEKPKQPLPRWDRMIYHEVLENLGKSLPEEPNYAAVADAVIEKKLSMRDEYHAMTPITTADIMNAMTG